MSMREWSKTPAMRGALTLLSAAVLVTGWTLVHALRVEALPDSPPMTIASLETIARGAARPIADVSATVDNNVFSIDRSAPSAAYRMPGDPDPNARPAAMPEKPLLLGTVIATDGRSFATLALADGRPMLVHVGDKIGEWIVRAIERGKVTLVSTAGIRLDVTVPKSGI
jgi:hypothetical protein